MQPVRQQCDSDARQRQQLPKRQAEPTLAWQNYSLQKHTGLLRVARQQMFVGPP